MSLAKTLQIIGALICLSGNINLGEPGGREILFSGAFLLLIGVIIDVRHYIKQKNDNRSSKLSERNFTTDSE